MSWRGRQRASLVEARASLAEALLPKRSRPTTFSEDSDSGSDEHESDDEDPVQEQVHRKQRLRRRHHETVSKMFEDMEDVVLCHLGVKQRDGLTLSRLVRNHNCLKICGEHEAVRRAIGQHHFQMRLARKLEWRKLHPFQQNKFKDCNKAVFFRVKIGNPDNEASETAKFPRSLVGLTLVQTDYEVSKFMPTDANVRGCWTGWTLTFEGETFKGEMSNSFLITFGESHKETFQITPRLKYFAFSYPVSNWKKAPLELQNFCKYGGFMYFYRKGRKARPFETQTRELGQIMSVKPAEGGKPFLGSGPPVWLEKEAVERQWNNMKEVTAESLKEGGAKYFCWVAPGDRVHEHEDCPLGYPHGGYLYLGKFNPDDIQSDRQEDGTHTYRWWEEHLTALQHVVDQKTQTRGKIEKEMIEKLRRSLSSLPPESSIDLRRNFTDPAHKNLLEILHQARYIFQLPEENLMFSTVYFSLFWFRFPFMFLMTSMLITAAFLGALMQVMFTVFGDIYDQGNEADFSHTAGEFIAFLLLPSLMIVCAMLLDQIWDLIFSAFSPPYFVEFRTRLLTVCIGLGRRGHKTQFRAPSGRLCKWVDCGFLFGFEVVPILGALYNAVLLNLPEEWGLNFIPHFFYLGHMGKADSILGGYLSGMMYNCMGMVLIYTAVDIGYAVLEWSLPPERSLRFVSEKVKDAIEMYEVYPMSMWYHHAAFVAAFDARDASDFGESGGPEFTEADNTNPCNWVGRYHEHGLNQETTTMKKFWKVYKKLDLLIWHMPWWLMVSYLWTQAVKPKNEQLFEAFAFLPDYAPWLVTALFLGIAAFHTTQGLEAWFPNLVGYTFRACLAFFCLVQLFLFFGGASYRPHTAVNSDDKLDPIMTMKSDSTNWAPLDSMGAQPYPICSMSWGDPDSSVSALDLAALSWIVYEKNQNDIESLLHETFGPGPQLENFTDYDEIPRWIAVKFPPGWKNLGSNGKKSGGGSEGVDTVVVAVKGTSTFKDGYLDTDLFTAIKVLQFFEFLAPVLKILPVDMVQWMLKEVKFGTGGGKELNIWGKLKRNVTILQNATKRSTKFVLTGHSLGGGIAQIVAAQLGIKALVWSAPGTLYSQGFFSGKDIGSVSEERMQRNVVNVMPDNDGVPRVDSQESVVQRIQCFGIDHTPIHYFGGTKECHPIVKSACEVWRVCGDVPLHRNFNNKCSEFVRDGERGKLYPVLGHPILEPNETK